MLASIWRTAAEALFPATCIGCGLRGTALCSACRLELPFLPVGVCRRCAALRMDRGVCHGCRQLSPHLHAVRAAFAYEGAARTAVLALKFHARRRVALLMGELLGATLAARPLHADVIVPVPLSRERLKQRGYNQALLLARELAPTTRAHVLDDALQRRDRPPQQTLTATQRLTNLRDAFACTRPEAVAQRRVMLIDDVVTTGATLSACAEALARAGAARITGVAFARDL